MKKLITVLSVMILTLTTRVYAIDVADADDIITQTGTYDSTRLVAGNTVTSKAEIDGLSLIAGNEIITEGKSTYGFYAGNNILINEKVEKDLFAAGSNITIGPDAEIGRDVFIAGNMVKIKTNLNRDLRMGGSIIDISGVTIKGDAYLAASQIIMDEETVIEGKLKYPEETTVKNLEQAQIGSVETYQTVKVEVRYNMMDRVRDFCVGTVASFLTLVVLFFIIPNAKEKLDNTELTVEGVLKRIGLGLVTLISVPIITIIGLITVVLIPVSLITLTLYVIAIYLSTLLVYYVVGKEIAKKLNKENKYLAIILGILTIKLIKLVPYIGGIVGILAVLYGMGLITKYIFSRKSN